MTTIRYFIPEDGDSEVQPNVFLAPKPRQQGYPPSLGQVKLSFPLPGKYHFRFKSPLVPGTDREKGAMPVWMDCVDDRQPVPTWKSTVVAKVTRLAVEDDDDDDDDDFHRPAAAATHNQQQQHHTPAPTPQQPTPQPSVDLFGGPSPSSDTGNLLGGHHHHQQQQQVHHQQQQQAPPPQQQQADLLGGMHQHHQAAPHSGGSDLLGMGSQTSATPPISGNSYGYPQQQSGPFF